MSDYEQTQASIEAISTDGVPDRDKAQADLTTKFIGALLLRGGDTPDEVAERFGGRYAGTLRWLGKSRQDEILRVGMAEANVDLSHWLAKKGE